MHIKQKVGEKQTNLSCSKSHETRWQGVCKALGSKCSQKYLYAEPICWAQSFGSDLCLLARKSYLNMFSIQMYWELWVKEWEGEWEEEKVKILEFLIDLCEKLILITSSLIIAVITINVLFSLAKDILFRCSRYLSSLLDLECPQNLKNYRLLFSKCFNFIKNLSYNFYRSKFKSLRSIVHWAIHGGRELSVDEETTHKTILLRNRFNKQFIIMNKRKRSYELVPKQTTEFVIQIYNDENCLTEIVCAGKDSPLADFM